MTEFIDDMKTALGQKPIDPENEVAEALGYKELCEPLLKEYHMVSRKIAQLEELKDLLRKQILGFSGPHRGAMTFGGMTLLLKDRKGSVSVDWESYVSDEIGEKAIKEILEIRDMVKDGKATSKYMKCGKPSVTVEVAEGAETPDV